LCRETLARVLNGRERGLQHLFQRGQVLLVVLWRHDTEHLGDEICQHPGREIRGAAAIDKGDHCAFAPQIRGDRYVSNDACSIISRDLNLSVARSQTSRATSESRRPTDTADIIRARF
jgi:hypothetical protein